MQTPFDFNFDRFCEKLKRNFPICGEKGMEKDAQLIYFLFKQKYAKFEIEKIFQKIREIQELSSDELTIMLSKL